MGDLSELGFEKVKQGAEARLYVGKYLGKKTLVKERFEKRYRHPVLDTNITKDRIKAEVRAIIRCKIAGISTPAVYLVDLQRRSIFMEYIEGITAKEFIESLEKERNSTDNKENSVIESTIRQLGTEIGQVIGRMHTSSIIHGDLTSSNILVCFHEDELQSEMEQQQAGIEVVKKWFFRDPIKNIRHLHLVLIDFGLGKTDSSAEDKGVDLYVLERALLSTHPSIAPNLLFPAVMKGYSEKCGRTAKDVIVKLEEVRMRGRKRTMVG